LSSGVPAGITMLVFCDQTESDNRETQMNTDSVRCTMRILHLEETYGQKAPGANTTRRALRSHAKLAR